MLLSVAVSNLASLVYLLLPALTFVHGTTPENRIKLLPRDIRRLSTPLRTQFQKRNTILFASQPSPSNLLALNSTNGEVLETIPFQQQIDIPGSGRGVYFFIKGEIDDDYTLTVEFWVHYLYDRTIGVFQGDLRQGVDMRIPDSMKVVNGEARLYVASGRGYEVLVFEMYGSVQQPGGPSKVFPHILMEIKRWKAGNIASIQGVSQTGSNDAASVE